MAINPFKRKPIPTNSASSDAHKPVFRSSGSSARKKHHMASAIVSVRVASGIKIRVKRKRPIDVLKTRPE